MLFLGFGLLHPTFPLPGWLMAGLWFWVFNKGANLLLFLLLLTALFCRYFHLCVCNHVGTHGSMKEVWCRYARRDKSFWTGEFKRGEL